MHSKDILLGFISVQEEVTSFLKSQNISPDFLLMLGLVYRTASKT